jgi:hypothetical protein
VGLAVSRRPIRLSLLDAQIISELLDDLHRVQPFRPEEIRAEGTLREQIAHALAPPVDKSKR